MDAFAISQFSKELGLSAEHDHSVAKIHSYFKTHRINELMNELMTNTLQERPQDARAYILQSLRSMTDTSAQKDKDPLNKNIYKFSEPYLQQEDFLAIFESYDVLGIQTVPVCYLEQALQMVGVEDAKHILKDRYSDLIQDNTVNKVSFVYVLQEEHKRSGFSYARPE